MYCHPAALLENDGADSVHQDPVFQVTAYGPGQDTALDLSTDTNHVVHRVPVRDVGDILVDDRPGVEFRRDVVRRRPDDLHPPGVCLVVRARPDECRQERVMDVDDRLAGGVRNWGERICM